MLRCVRGRRKVGGGFDDLYGDFDLIFGVTDLISKISGFGFLAVRTCVL